MGLVKGKDVSQAGLRRQVNLPQDNRIPRTSGRLKGYLKKKGAYKGAAPRAKMVLRARTFYIPIPILARNLEGGGKGWAVGGEGSGRTRWATLKDEPLQKKSCFKRCSHEAIISGRGAGRRNHVEGASLTSETKRIRDTTGAWG